MKIVLSNGNEIDNLELDGSCYRSEESLEESMFEGVSMLKVVDGESEVTMYVNSIVLQDENKLIIVNQKTELDIINDSIAELAQMLGGLM